MSEQPTSNPLVDQLLEVANAPVEDRRRWQAALRDAAAEINRQGVEIRTRIAVAAMVERDAAGHLAKRDAEIERLHGDLNIARLERDAKLCSQCPRTPELERLRAFNCDYPNCTLKTRHSHALGGDPVR